MNERETTTASVEGISPSGGVQASVAERWFAIVNPVAGSGRGLTDWPIISKLLRDNRIAFDFAFTERKFHATELAVEAVVNGYRRIIVVGGDGTIHEAVNGLFIQRTVPTTDVLLAVIAVGTGNDWIRMFGIPRKYTEAIRAIVSGHSFLQDVGYVTYYESMYHQHRYMANVAGIGFDAYVNRRYNRLKEAGRYSKWLYVTSMLRAVFRYRSTRVRIWVDDTLISDAHLYSAAVGIGKYNGGGMQQTPHAIADDGLFDITLIKRIGRLSVLRRLRSLYNGRIYDIPQASFYRGRKIRIESRPEIAIEVDGEALGYSDFTFDIRDKAIRAVVGEKFTEAAAGTGGSALSLPEEKRTEKKRKSGGS